MYQVYQDTKFSIPKNEEVKGVIIIFKDD